MGARLKDRAIYLTEHMMTTDRTLPIAAPDDWWAEGIGAFLTRVSTRFDGEGVVLLCHPGARLLGLPAEGTLPVGGIDHPAVQDAQRAGWNVGGNRISDWTTFYASGRPSIRLGLVNMMDLATDRQGRPHRSPLFGPKPEEMVRACALWQRLTGSAWVGTPGMAGMQVMSDLAPRRDAGGKAPTWKPTTTRGPVGPDGAFEDDYRVEQFRRPAAPYSYLHGYDANRMYIAAAMLLEACPWTLKHTGRTVWSPRLAGWWQVELSPWAEKRLPNPAGYAPDEERQMVRWVTGPTMHLLHDLTEEGVYGGVRILDSWTGPARKGALRPWAERMRDAYQLFDQGTSRMVPLDNFSPEDVERVRFAIKCAGRETLGLLDRASNWAYRPDWWYAVVALARANLFRKMWKASQATTGMPARWPCRIDVDNVYYPSDEPDATKAAPGAFSIDDTGLVLGSFKAKNSLRVKVAR